MRWRDRKAVTMSRIAGRKAAAASISPSRAEVEEGFPAAVCPFRWAVAAGSAFSAS